MSRDFHWATPPHGAPKPRSRAGRWVVRGVVVVGVLGALAAGAYLLWDVVAESVSGESEPVQRRGMAGLKPGWPALPEIPDGVPFVKAHPLQRPDSTVLLALLKTQRFAELDAAMEAYQSAFEADPKKEAWPRQALQSFSVGHPEIGQWIDGWIAASPESFGAWAARGAWRMAMAYEARGGKYTPETKPAQLAAMRAEHDNAVVDLQRALELRPKLVAAVEMLLWIARWAGDRKALHETYRWAVELCPRCVKIRVTYVLGHAPRWGGSYEEMDALAAKAPTGRHPRMKVLAGLAAYDRARLLREQGKHAAALTQATIAVRTGPRPAFFCEQARNLNHLERYVEALGPLDEALRRDPQHYSCLRARESARRWSKDYVGAAEDLLTLRRLDPHDDLDDLVDWTMQRLRYDARQAMLAGKPELDKELRTLANKILPGGADPGPRGGATEDQLADLFKQVESSPDDFELHLRLDQALAARGRFDDIVTMWDAFIANHPNHARAHEERGGANWHAGHHQAAITDTAQACTLGQKSACTNLPHMRQRASE